jgi:hypothetical protein
LPSDGAWWRDRLAKTCQESFFRPPPLKVISREEFLKRLWRGASVAVLCAAFLIAESTLLVSGSAQEHFIDYSADSSKVVFMSGNLTAAMTYAWPRVIFQHSTDLFSPSFEVGLPMLYLFNDTNRDDLFERSEAVYTGYLDSYHNVTWTPNPVEFGNGTVSGEFAEFRMNASVSLYEHAEDLEAAVPDWGNISFLFRINQNPVMYSNSYGSYLVQGKTELMMNFTLMIGKRLNLTGLAVEHLLKGGGSTDMFMIREASSRPATFLTPVYSRNDELVNGLNFTNKISETYLPYQEILFAKEDSTVQAFYHYSSEPMRMVGGNLSASPMSSSYLTTGTGMLLHTAYVISNDTESLSHNASVGIIESGFNVHVSDWLKRNLAVIMAVVGSIVAIVSIGLLVMALRKKPSPPQAPQQPRKKS